MYFCGSYTKRMLKRIAVGIGLALCFVLQIVAQTGGNSVYNFLSYSYSTRQLALGSGLISVYDSDPTLIITNPSFIGERHSQSLALNFTNSFAKTNYGSVLYAQNFKKVGSFAAELRCVGYGTFQGMDESGAETHTFNPGDYALTLGWGRELTPHFTIGANLKMIFCNYDQYNSFGLAVDVAGSYFDTAKNLSVTLLAKNIGSELKTFTPGHFEKLPFDLQLAMSQRLKHVPFRYHISLHSLYRWNMNYYGPENPYWETDAITNEVVYPTKTAQFFDNLFRHFIFGLEIEPVSAFSLQLSYNHNIHQEMKVLARHSLAGFSYGFMINVRSIQFGFARQHFAPGAAPNCFNLALNFEELSKLHQEKKTKKLERVD